MKTQPQGLDSVKCARIGLAVLILMGCRPSMADTPAGVPPEYQDLYTSLNGYLDSFNTTLRSSWNGSTSPVLYTAWLKNADANAGPQLVNTGYFNGVQLQLQELKAMGVKAVLVEVGFPMLYRPFFASDDDYNQYVAFYQNVASAVREAGLKLVVENNCLLSADVQAGWDSAPFYATLDWDQYRQARAETAVVIAQTMRPDYMVVVEEPDIEAEMSGQANANTVDGSTALLNDILTAVHGAGIAGTLFGGGVGNWLYGYDQYISSYVSLPVDFIDMHIYGAYKGLMPNAIKIAQIAASAGKPVTMTECWLNKVRDSEVNVVSQDVIRARNPLSFWAPLDSYFIQTVENLANYSQMLFMAPTGSEYFFAYQDYDSTRNLSPGQMLAQEMQSAANANQSGSYSSTGLSYYTSIVNPPDSEVPSAPDGLSGVSGNPTQTALLWSPSSDNVGVSAYKVYRDGEPVATTGQPQFQDFGLTGSRTYTYYIEALDLGGNISAPSTFVSVTTKDVVAPDPPANVSASAVSCKQINVTWTPSADDIAISSYRVFWGPTPTDLTQVATTYGTTLSYTSAPLTAGTTYYYGVQAVDKSGNVSVMSVIASATTLALPSPPAAVNASVISTRQVNVTWSDGPIGMPIASYRIYRGTSGGSLVQIATRTTGSYNDASLSAGTTYSYAVQTMDTGGNLSGLSAPVSATTLPGPTPPTGLTATGVTTKKVTLNWNAGAAGVRIVSFRVYHGPAGSGLSQYVTVVNPTYTEATLNPGASYTYAIAEVDSDGNVSAQSPAILVSTLPAPMPPTVVATPISTRKITLSWTPGPSGVAVVSYQLFRGTAQGSLALLVKTTNTTYTDVNLTPGTTYYYAVAEVDSDGNVSSNSPTVSATVLALPSAPASLAADVVSTKQINLTWVPGTSGVPVVSYRISRGTSGSALSQIATTKSTSYSDKTVAAGTTYYYSVVEVDSDGNVSPSSAVVSASTYASPSAPKNVTAAASSTKLITVTWAPGSSGMPVASYRIWKGSSPSSLAQVGNTTKTSYSDTSLPPATTYYYAVQEVDTDGNVSPLSAVVSAATLALPSAPRGVTATAVYKTQISVTWNAAASGMPLASYKVYRGTAPTGLAQVGTVSASKTSFTDYPVTAGTTYYYAVQAADTGGNVSDLSSVVSVTTSK